MTNNDDRANSRYYARNNQGDFVELHSPFAFRTRAQVRRREIRASWANELSNRDENPNYRQESIYSIARRIYSQHREDANERMRLTGHPEGRIITHHN